jgi:hypothetical protein
MIVSCWMRAACSAPSCSWLRTAAFGKRSRRRRLRSDCTRFAFAFLASAMYAKEGWSIPKSRAIERCVSTKAPNRSELSTRLPRIA